MKATTRATCVVIVFLLGACAPHQKIAERKMLLQPVGSEWDYRYELQLTSARVQSIKIQKKDGAQWKNLGGS